jgi:hypothetical protein
LNRNNRAAILAILSVLVFSVLVFFQQPPANARKATFSCELSEGNPPKTVVERQIGGEVRKEDFIIWTSSFGHKAGYTPARRCEEVSPKFNKIGEVGSYVTHGRHKDNDLPIICTTNREGGGCKEMLYTLNPKSAKSPKEVIRDLFGVNKTDESSSTPRRENCPAYISIDRLLENKFSNKNLPFYNEVCR